jgi:hypothetical protein
MNIKNTAALLLILVTNTASMHAMEAPCSSTEKSLLDMEKLHDAFVQTPQYQLHERAKKLYEKHKTEETRLLMEETAGQLLETKESQLFMHMVEQKETEIKAAPIFSDNVITKHLAMTKTHEYIQYQEAKATHEQCNTADTLYIVNMCKIELNNTKECQEYLSATEQEMHVVTNIAKANNWPHAQKAPYSSSELDNQKMVVLKFKENKDAAWRAVTKTKEHQLFKQAKIDHEKNNTISSAIEFKRCKQAAKATNAYFNYCKASEEKRQLRVIESNHEQCLYDYPYIEKMIKKRNLTIISIPLEKIM